MPLVNDIHVMIDVGGSPAWAGTKSALTLTISGGGFEKEIVGGYVLAGATKQIGTQFTPEICKKIGKLRVVMKTDRVGTVERSFDLDANRCTAK